MRHNTPQPFQFERGDGKLDSQHLENEVRLKQAIRLGVALAVMAVGLFSYQNCGGMHALPTIENGKISGSGLERQSQDQTGAASNSEPSSPSGTQPTTSEPSSTAPLNATQFAEAVQAVESMIDLMEETHESLKGVSTLFLSNELKKKRTDALAQLQAGLNQLNTDLATIKANESKTAVVGALESASDICGQTIASIEGFDPSILPAAAKQRRTEILAQLKADQMKVDAIRASL